MLDFDDPDNNDWLAVNQFTVIENRHNRRPDIVVFVNGLPLAVIELKNAADENATIWTAFNQLQTYKARDPVALRLQRAAGHLRRPGGPRRHAHGRPGVVHALADDRRARRCADHDLPELEVLIEGVFDKRRFLDLVALLHRLRGRRAAERSRRRWPATTSSTPSTRRSRDAARGTCSRSRSRAESADATRPGAPGGEPETAASASSGTRRARARA